MFKFKIRYPLVCLSIVFFFNTSLVVSQQPKIVIGIVIEQLRNEMVLRYYNDLDENGLKLMMDEGTYFRNAGYNYYLSENASGISTIVSGAYPSCHGIISDYWYSKVDNQREFCIGGNRKKLDNGFYTNGNYTPNKLMTSTIGDELKISNFNQSKVISVGINPISSVLGGGRAADIALWLDDITGRWKTGDYYTDTTVQWIEEFNDKNLQDIYSEKSWSSYYPLDNYKNSFPDENEFEYGFPHYRNTFPYELKYLKERAGNYKYLKYTPFGNTFTKDLAVAAIYNEEMGQDEHTDFLMVSFSAFKYLAEYFGPRSVELNDAFIRLDKDVAHFIQFLDEYVGKGNYLIFLTSDRGMNELPTYLHSMKQSAGVFDMEKSLILLNTYLSILYGDSEWIAGYHSRQIFIDRASIDKYNVTMEEVQKTVSSFMIQYNGIKNAVPGVVLNYSDFSGGINRLFKNSYHQKRSGDVFINFESGWYEKTENFITTGSGSKTNRHVPLIWYGSEIRKGVVIDDPVDIVDIAPTISYLLRIGYPNCSNGRILNEIFVK